MDLDKSLILTKYDIQQQSIYILGIHDDGGKGFYPLLQIVGVTAKCFELCTRIINFTCVCS